MITSTYDPAVFDQLTASGLRDANAKAHPALKKLGRILCDYDVHDDIAIAYLHRHFALKPDELLLESLAPTGSITAPAALTESGIVPYLWKVERGDQGQKAWYPLEFVRVDGHTADAVRQAERLERQTDFLAAMADAIISLGVSNLFGITTLHRSVMLNDPDAIAHETTDRINRKLTLVSLPRADHDPTTGFETVWSFVPSGGSEVEGDCKGHCRNTCFGSGGHH